MSTVRNKGQLRGFSSFLLGIWHPVHSWAVALLNVHLCLFPFASPSLSVYVHMCVLSTYIFMSIYYTYIYVYLLYTENLIVQRYVFICVNYTFTWIN